MGTRAFVNGKVLIGDRFADDVNVIVSGSKIDRVAAGEDPGDCDDVVDLDGLCLLPGFVDTQVNGGGGVLFNDCPEVDTIAAIGAAHRKFGTTAFMPTLISDELDVVRRAMAATEAAIDRGVPGVIGIHVEGPYLNPDRRGVHDPAKLRAITAETVEQLVPIRNGKTLLTIAPEAAEPGIIKALQQKGVIVSAGHTDATYAETMAAIAEGLRGFTHLYNAMSQLNVREPGAVGAALDSPDTWAGIIADGHHVSPVSLRIAYRMIGRDRMMLVTDAMPPVGSDLTEFSLLGRNIVVENGICMDPDGTLAGTALDMSSAVRNMMQFTGCSLADASCMASLSPATFLGLNTVTGSIAPGKRADMVVVDRSLTVKSTVIGGRMN